ncbi:MAG: hypothetical protein AAF335_03540 [Bacteroidota bacterium]
MKRLRRLTILPILFSLTSGATSLEAFHLSSSLKVLSSIFLFLTPEIQSETCGGNTFLYSYDVNITKDDIGLSVFESLPYDILPMSEDKGIFSGPYGNGTLFSKYYGRGKIREDAAYIPDIHYVEMENNEEFDIYAGGYKMLTKMYNNNTMSFKVPVFTQFSHAEGDKVIPKARWTNMYTFRP